MIGNIETKEHDGKVSIDITVNKAGEVSRTGKSKVHASTSGFIKVGNYRLSLNLISA